MVARDDHQDPAGAGSRHAPAHTDHLSGRLRRRQLAVSGRRLSRPVRRGADFLLQLADAALPPRSADRRGDGKLCRGRRVPPRALGRDLHGRRHLVHGARRAESCQGCHGPGRRRRGARRRACPHRGERRGPLPRRKRSRVLAADPRVRRTTAGQRAAPRNGGRRAATEDRSGRALRPPPPRSSPVV